MRSGLLASLFLVGCSLGPPPAITPPTPPSCLDLRQAVVGVWAHESRAMDVRADGTIVRDGLEGGFRWRSPGNAIIDVAGSHEEHTFGLMTGAQLLDIDENGRALTWSRVSLVPAFDVGCFDLRGSIVGDWTDGQASESFQRDGAYVRGEARGNWSTADQGYLDIAVGMRVRRYRIALAAPDLLISAFDGPLVDEDPRGASLVEVRIR